MPKRALIIANEEYDDPRFPALPGAGADADGLSEVLADPLIGEFEVTVVRNGRTDEIRMAIEQLFGTASRDDMLLLHISAHGRKDLKGRLHFVATNTRQDYLGATAVAASYINEQLADSLSRRIVLLLDCCYSGAFTHGMRTRDGEPVVDLTELNGRGRIVITASAALQYSHEREVTSRGAAQPGVFTRAVIEGLRSGAADIDGDGYVTVDELYRYVYDEVRRSVAAQTPTRSVDRVEGTLILARNPAYQAPPPVEPGVPAPVQAAVAGQHPWQRIGALHELGRLLASVRDSTRQTALDLVLLLAADADPEVAAAARRLLVDRGLADRIPPTADVRARPTAGMHQRPAAGAATLYTLGVDFGTTNSVVAAYVADDVEIIPSREGVRSTPSCVAFTADGGVLVGDAAERQAVLHPATTVRGIKLRLGSDWTTTAYGLTYTAEQVASMVLRKLRTDAEEYLGEPVHGAVITVPAYFTNVHREALAEAAALAELPLMRILNEPTAAALAYGLDKIERNQIVAVFDLGGGTCDVSILELGEGVLEIKATGGDLRLGGNDWDERVIEHLATRFHQEHGINLHRDRAAMHRLREAAERAKIELSAMTVATVRVPYIAAGPSGPLHLDVLLTRAEFEDLTRDLVARCRDVFQRAAEDAQAAFSVKTDRIDHIVLVGGATRMPAIIEMARQLCEGREPSRAIIPEGVATGAAVQAGVLAGAVKDALLLDVMPLSIGIITAGGISTKLIERNTTIPTRRSEVFTTAEDNQPTMEIHLTQGEQKMAHDNARLGSLVLHGIPPAPRGVPQIEITVDIDANGILHVCAKELILNGQEVSMTVSRESVRKALPVGERLPTLLGPVEMRPVVIRDLMTGESSTVSP